MAGLVEDSPSVTPEGSVILGSQHTTVYIVNAASGSLIHAFTEVNGKAVTLDGYSGELSQLHSPGGRGLPIQSLQGMMHSSDACSLGRKLQRMVQPATPSCRTLLSGVPQPSPTSLLQTRTWLVGRGPCAGGMAERQHGRVTASRTASTTLGRACRGQTSMLLYGPPPAWCLGLDRGRGRPPVCLEFLNCMEPRVLLTVACMKAKGANAALGPACQEGGVTRQQLCIQQPMCALLALLYVAWGRTGSSAGLACA